jgi:hypothetical protein
MSAAAVLAGVLLIWGIDLGRRLIGVSNGTAGPALAKQLAASELELARMTAERDELAAKLKAALAQPAAQPAPFAAVAEGEVGKLVADLALVEEALPQPKTGSGLQILGLQARMATSKQLHYTVLLAYGGKKAHAAFEGKLKLSVMVLQEGKKAVLEFPQDDAERYALKVARYQRVDGTLDLPDGATARGVQISLLEKGKVVASETTILK